MANSGEITFQGVIKSFPAAIESIGAALLSIVGMALQIHPMQEAARQRLNELMPVNMPAIADIVALRRQGMLSQENYIGMMRAQGFEGEVSENLYRTALPILDLRELIIAARKKAITEEEWSSEVQRMGFSELQGRAINSAITPIPQVQDVIRFAVREVYNPLLSQFFGQFEGGEEVYNIAKPDIDALGLSQKHFMDFWAAHWELPALTMGFEMFHRGIIPEGENNQPGLTLRSLMKAQDIMPGWVEPLIQLSYNNLTRVDTRRMYELGVINEQEVYEAYLDQGYSPENAKRMLKFTIALTLDPAELEKRGIHKRKELHKDLSKAELLTGYKEGLLTSNEAAALLNDLGYSPEEILFYIEKADMENQKEAFGITLKSLEKKYKSGVLSDLEVRVQLDKIGIKPDKAESYIDLWTLSLRDEAAAIPLQDWLSWWSKSLISKSKIEEVLKQRGYSAEVIDHYVKAALL